MIDIRPLNPVRRVGDPDTRIARFEESEWRDLIELVRRYGFEPLDLQTYYPQAYDRPVEIDPETSQGLWEAISDVYKDDAVPPGVPSFAVGRVRVKQLMECAQIGADQGGIEIRRAREED